MTVRFCSPALILALLVLGCDAPRPTADPSRPEPPTVTLRGGAKPDKPKHGGWRDTLQLDDNTLPPSAEDVQDVVELAQRDTLLALDPDTVAPAVRLRSSTTAPRTILNTRGVDTVRTADDTLTRRWWTLTETLTVRVDSSQALRAPAPVPSPSTTTTTTTKYPGIGAGLFIAESDLLTTPDSSLVVFAASPSSIVQTLATLKKTGRRACPAFAGGNHTQYATVSRGDSTWSFAKWRARVDRFAPYARTIMAYADSGTVVCHYLIDEPLNYPAWFGHKIPFAAIDSTAAYNDVLFERRVPGYVRDNPTGLVAYVTTSGQSAWRSLDGAWLQWSVAKGSVTSYLSDQRAAATRAGLGLIMGINIVNGGTRTVPCRYGAGTYSVNCEMSPVEALAAARVLIAAPEACAFTMWQQDRARQQEPEWAATFAEIRRLGRAHPPRSCQVRP